MCLGPELLLAAGALGLGGSVAANTAAQGQINDERNRVMAAEAARQAEYDKQISDLNEGMSDRFGKFGKKQEKTTANLADLYSSQSAKIPQTLTGAPAAAGNVITQQGEKSAAKTSKDLEKQATARADFRGFGDTLGSVGFAGARDAGRISTLGGFKQGSSAILGHELEQANQAGAGLQLLGDVLGGLGGLGISAGIGGPGLAGLFGTGLAPAATSVVPAPRPFVPTPAAGPPLPVPRPGGMGLTAGLY